MGPRLQVRGLRGRQCWGRGGGGGGGGGRLLVYIYTTEGLLTFQGFGSPILTAAGPMHVQGRQVAQLQCQVDRLVACWHPEGAQEVAVAPTAAAQGGGRGRLHKKSEEVDGGECPIS